MFHLAGNVPFSRECSILFVCCLIRFDYLHKKQSGGAGQYGRVIGHLEVIGAQSFVVMVTGEVVFSP